MIYCDNYDEFCHHFSYFIKIGNKKLHLTCTYIILYITSLKNYYISSSSSSGINISASALLPLGSPIVGIAIPPSLCSDIGKKLLYLPYLLRGGYRRHNRHNMTNTNKTASEPDISAKAKTLIPLDDSSECVSIDV